MNSIRRSISSLLVYALFFAIAATAEISETIRSVEDIQPLIDSGKVKRVEDILSRLPEDLMSNLSSLSMVIPISKDFITSK